MAESFFQSAVCLGRQHCASCREWGEAGRAWRENIAKTYDTGRTYNFACPYGVPWINKPAPPAPPDSPPPPPPPPPPEGPSAGAATTERPTPTARQAATFIGAVLGGKYAPPDVVAERMATCRQCEFWRVDKGNIEWCGVCGCKVSATNRELANLAAYEENLPKWGCKHPKRAEGKGWKR